MKISIIKSFKKKLSSSSGTSSRSTSVDGATGEVSAKSEDHIIAPNVRRPIKRPSVDDATGGVSAADVRRPSLTSLPSSIVFDDAADAVGEHHTSAADVRRPSLTSIPEPIQCPFLHGTVYADPYPGYVHGNPKRGICPNGCRPVMTSKVTELESPRDVLLREAIEFVQLYYHERSDEMQGIDGFLSCEERISEIKESIYATGTYVHTFDELQHGAQVAWRNAPKCSNRKYWQQLKLLDQRMATSNQEIFDSCIKHLSKAMSCGVSEAYITVFQPATPGKVLDGSYIWNDQLLQYAAYGNGDAVIGDPKNLRFTEMLKERFGWDGPSDGIKGAHDYLPLIIQARGQKPELFELPRECARPVQIHHPRYPELSSLNMQWYPVPAVCALDLTVGGILYTAAPFNGWYANTEVLRDLTDECRFNMLIPVAEALGMEIDTKPGEAPLWKDEVMHILSSAVYHSFKSAKIAMIDHHTLIDMFWAWYREEMKTRKYCPVNWKWVIPPMSSSTSRAYLGLNKAQDYTLKPAYLLGTSPFQLEVKYFGKRDTSLAMKKLLHCIWLAIVFKRCINRMRGRKQPVVIAYASVTGNAARYASDLGAILRSSCNVSFVDACGVNAAEDMLKVFPLIHAATLVIFVSSTQGNGELPSLARKFFAMLFGKHGNLLSGKHCAVLGFGSSSYPIFCGAASQLSTMLAKVNANEVVPHGKCDSVKGEALSFYDWTTNLVAKMATMRGANPLMLKLSSDIKDGNASSLVRARNMVHYVKVEVFTAKEVETAAAMSYMTQRRGSMGTISRRRISMDSIDSSERSLVDSSGRRRSSIDSSGRASGRRISFEQFLNGENLTPHERIMRIMSASSMRTTKKDILEGQVKSREDIISRAVKGEGSVTRKTSLIKIDLKMCGDPPYQPGDHVRIFPRNNAIDLEQLQMFVLHLSRGEEFEVGGDCCLDDHILVSFKNESIPRSELAASWPLLSKCLHELMPLEYFFDNQVALESPISMQTCLDLSQLATSDKDRAVLTGLGNNSTVYEDLISMSGLKWIDLFKIFPSLSKQVTINFLLCNMKPNHARSYSISSCKEVVGSELHIVVGRHIYSRGGSKKEVGVCSNFLTQVEPGDEISFNIESTPSFQYPLDPLCPIIFICTGTGFAPIRGLLQKRSYFQSRSEKLGPSFLIFGSRSSSEGLFHDEIVEFQEQGALTEAFMCYSREVGVKKEYTQDKLRSIEVIDRLGPFLAEPNTHIFICGSANMAESCKVSLCEISSQDLFDSIVESGRLHCDVFGALLPKAREEKPPKDERMSGKISSTNSLRRVAKNSSANSLRRAVKTSRPSTLSRSLFELDRTLP